MQVLRDYVTWLPNGGLLIFNYEVIRYIMCILMKCLFLKDKYMLICSSKLQVFPIFCRRWIPRWEKPSFFEANHESILFSHLQNWWSAAQLQHSEVSEMVYVHIKPLQVFVKLQFFLLQSSNESANGLFWYKIRHFLSRTLTIFYMYGF